MKIKNRPFQQNLIMTQAELHCLLRHKKHSATNYKKTADAYVSLLTKYKQILLPTVNCRLDCILKLRNGNQLHLPYSSCNFRKL
jgi:hypothetical protein